MPKNNQQYDIQVTRYIKRPTGKKNSYGNIEYTTVGDPKIKVIKNTNFSNLKKDLYEQSKKKDNVYIDYTKPIYRITKVPPRIKSVTVRYTNGDKQVSYYKAIGKR